MSTGEGFLPYLMHLSPSADVVHMRIEAWQAVRGALAVFPDTVMGLHAAAESTDGLQVDAADVFM